MRGDDPKFMRSSIYTILVNSDEQNTRLDQEAQETDAEGYAATLQESGLSSLGGLRSTPLETNLHKHTSSRRRAMPHPRRAAFLHLCRIVF